MGTTSPSRSNRIIVFTRYPEAGSTKTRLIPALGPQGAAELHKQLTEHTLREANRFARAEIEIAWTGGDESGMRAWVGGDVRLRPQVTGDLGARMAAAFRTAIDEGASRVVIVGSDCPDVNPQTYQAAFEALGDHDLVLGPAVDGGYYLIGIRAATAAAIPTLMDGVEWSTSRVFDETLARARRERLRVARLALLEDVDRPEDLDAWRRHSGELPRPWLSVVVCALNDAARLRDSLAALGEYSDAEVIIADGGSADATKGIALEMGARVVDAPRGRAAQFNLGAARSAGDTLLFLHADTRVPAGYREEIRECLARPGAIAGAFRFATDYDSRSMRIIAASANVRARRFQLPYGDQALFLRRTAFHRAGGFPVMPIMEDYALVRRLQRLNHIEIARSAAITSGERWRRRGPWRTTLRNASIVALYELGVSPDRLVDLYRRSPE